MSDYTNKSFKDVELVKGEVYTIGWIGSETSLSPYRLLDYRVEETDTPYKKEYLYLNLGYLDKDYSREVRLPKGITLFICKGEQYLDLSALISEKDRINKNVNYWTIFEDFIRYLVSQVKAEDIIYTQVEKGKIHRYNQEDSVVTVLVKSCLRDEWWYNSLVGMILRVDKENSNNSNYYYLVDNPLKIHKSDAIEINV